MKKLDPNSHVTVDAALVAISTAWADLDNLHYWEGQNLDSIIKRFGPDSPIAQARATGRAILANAMDLIGRAAQELEKLKE